ncbi:MAG: adenosylcobinamide kinase/adenosylcobinamide-phosphate guanylyltransferase [Psychrobacter glaciei]|jgi:adenosylcobinamide kinase/adenosylcobinamide-phosphate guanylyltransferase
MSTDENMLDLHLILGGARSGKSRYGESLAADSAYNVKYVATARALDHEMEQRIAQHKLERPDHWESIEEPTELHRVISESNNCIILVDCLTLWLMNIMDSGVAITLAVDNLIDALQSRKTPVILVSNEITMGVVPMGEMSRQYVDELGRLHQKIAQQANKVTLMVAGLPLTVK